MTPPEEETGSWEESGEAAVIDCWEGGRLDHWNSTTEECEKAGWAATADDLGDGAATCPGSRRCWLGWFRSGLSEGGAEEICCPDLGGQRAGCLPDRIWSRRRRRS